ncbi:MAG: hypothetical protein ABR985_07670 [Methanotrichaceae archaeon]|jgi:hypothetical protein
MRCPEFYEKWKRNPNFCERDPRTAEQIEAYLDEVQILGDIATNCSTGEEPRVIAEMQISECALRPLISEKDERVHNEAAKQIVKLAKEKADKGLKVIVTGPEVSEILSRVRGTRRAEEEAKKAQVIANVVEVAKETVDPLDPDSRYGLQDAERKLASKPWPETKLQETADSHKKLLALEELKQQVEIDVLAAIDVVYSKYQNDYLVTSVLVEVAGTKNKPPEKFVLENRQLSRSKC